MPGAGSGSENAQLPSTKKEKKVKRAAKGTKRFAVARYHVRGRNLRAVAVCRTTTVAPAP